LGAVAEGFPIKQGLKLFSYTFNLTFFYCCRRISNKTRIETFKGRLLLFRLFRCRRISNKTRIETSPFHMLFLVFLPLQKDFQ